MKAMCTDYSPLKLVVNYDADMFERFIELVAVSGCFFIEKMFVSIHEICILEHIVKCNLKIQ